MRNFETERQRKIETLMGLIDGSITADQIPPSFLLKVSPEGNSCFINGRSVDEKTFNKRLENTPAICDFKTVGRIDDLEEIYY